MVYARTENGNVVEYPVFEVHIQTRGHRIDMYREVVELDKPDYDDNSQILIKSINVVNGTPTISYTIESLPCPLIVSMRQARIKMSRMGILATVQTVIESLDEEAKIEWEYSTTFERNNTLVSQISETMGIDDEAMNTLFKEAYEI